MCLYKLIVRCFTVDIILNGHANIATQTDLEVFALKFIIIETAVLAVAVAVVYVVIDVVVVTISGHSKCSRHKLSRDKN